MEVAVCIRWTVIVHHNVDTLDIDATTKDICCDQNTLFEIFECSVTLDTE